MAIAQIYSAVPNDVITAARWNNEFGNIYNNGTALAFPVTTAVSFAGFTLTLDSSGVTTLQSSSSTGFIFTPGPKSGAPGTTGYATNIVAATGTDSTTAGSGTASIATFNTLQRPTLAASNTLVTTTDAATFYIANSPLAGTNETITNAWAIWVDAGNVRFDGNLTQTGQAAFGGPISSTSPFIVGTLVPQGHISALTYSRDAGDLTNDILVAVGEAVSDDVTPSSRRLMVLSSSLIKQLDASWVVGTNQGMLDSGVVGNNPYYLFLIQRSDTGVVDILASLSATAPTMPANYAFKRLFGYIERLAGVNTAFTVYELSGGGLEFQWTTPTIDVTLANTLTTARRTDAVRVPLAFSTIARIRVLIDDAALINVIVSNPDEADAAPSVTVAPGANVHNENAALDFAIELEIRTSSAGLIAARATTATIDSYIVITAGFKWSRR